MPELRYLHPAHFARVEVMLEPLLGYFFTLDPLGYKGDQLIALYGILGQAVTLRESGRWATSEWSDWLLYDFTRLCHAIMPKAMKYLSSGNYTGTQRGDLVEEFTASPAGRSKDRLPSLSVVVGWAHAKSLTVHADTDCQCAVSVDYGIPPLPLAMAFAEELWRRTLGFVYKGDADSVQVLLTMFLIILGSIAICLLRFLCTSGATRCTCIWAFKRERLGVHSIFVSRSKW